MEFTFADDAKQPTPTRPRMGPLVAVGGIHVGDTAVRELERGLEELCRAYGFGRQDRFKWSPRRELWMWKNLIEPRRAEFFEQILGLAQRLGVRASIVIVSSSFKPANPGLDAENDALTLFLERVEWQLRNAERDGVVIVDRPSGGRIEEGKFLLACAEKLQTGTAYVQHERIALNVLSASSDHSRCIQLADVVTSCTLARVGGEAEYSPRVFESVKPLLCGYGDRVGGIGLKLHPDFKFLNLYHWICDDKIAIRGSIPFALPMAGPALLYAMSPDIP